MKLRKNSVLRVLRGGSFYIGLRCLLSTERSGNAPVNRYNNYGFRLVVRRQG